MFYSYSSKLKYESCSHSKARPGLAVRLHLTGVTGEIHGKTVDRFTQTSVVITKILIVHINVAANKSNS